MSKDLIAVLHQILGFLKAAPISFDTEVVRDGKIVGYCFPIEYVNDLMEIQKQLKKINSTRFEIEQEAAIVAIQDMLRRGYQQAVIDSCGIKLFLINEFQQRLMLEAIYGHAIINETEDTAAKFGVTSEEIEAILQFASKRLTEGAYLHLQASKRKKQLKGDDRP